MVESVRFEHYEPLFENHMREVCSQNPDPSHDILHVKRVVQMARRLHTQEGGLLEVIVPAAYLHDSLYIAKNDPRRSQSSRLSAELAVELLKKWHYPEQYYHAIYHAIEAHSFSANVKALTLEAKIVQDADRLDAIGMIGVFRCLAYSGMVKRQFYREEDPFCEQCDPNDQLYTLDHFFVKLLKLNKMLHTESAKKEGLIRTQRIESFLHGLKQEIKTEHP